MDEIKAAGAIREYCSDNSLGVGDRLPPERRLVELLRMSRTQLRRGLARLEAERIITRTVGRGTFLLQSHSGAENISPRDVLVVRLLLEPAIVKLSIATATLADLGKLVEIMEASEKASTPDEWERLDAAFHTAIVKSTHNPLVVDLYDRITEARNASVWGELKRRSYSPESRAAYERHHRTIVEALTRRDLEAAEAGVMEHLRYVSNAMLGSDQP
ncbi:MAG: FCD domain-containing protein [Dehalococcoidia bacterium]|nr:FCD domain-containing protein [Dehalococcoidia bacterium]